jgi:hypothetical protein
MPVSTSTHSLQGSESEVWNSQAQYLPLVSSLVERVCSFLERYPLPLAGQEQVATAWAETVCFDTQDDRTRPGV